MTKLNTRSGQNDVGSQQQPRRGSIFKRVWMAVLSLLCIKGEYDDDEDDENETTNGLENQTTAVVKQGTRCTRSRSSTGGRQKSIQQKKTSSSKYQTQQDIRGNSLPRKNGPHLSVRSTLVKESSRKSSLFGTFRSAPGRLSLLKSHVVSSLPYGQVCCHLDEPSRYLDHLLPQVNHLDASSVTPAYLPWTELGSGSFGSVNLKELTGTNQLVAVKTAFVDSYNSSNEAWAKLCLEARAMKFLEGISAFPIVYGVYREGIDACKMVMEYIGDVGVNTCRSLMDVLHTGKPNMTAMECIDMVLELTRGLKAMHNLGLLHNDIAPRNILVYNDGTKYTGKCIDFGMVSAIKEPRRGDMYMQTFNSIKDRDRYIAKNPETAPERIIHAGYDSVKTDIYALGHVIGSLADVIDNDEMKVLCDVCQRFEPDNRPSVDEIIHFLKLAKMLELIDPRCRPLNKSNIILAGFSLSH